MKSNDVNNNARFFDTVPNPNLQNNNRTQSSQSKSRSSSRSKKRFKVPGVADEDSLWGNLSQGEQKIHPNFLYLLIFGCLFNLTANKENRPLKPKHRTYRSQPNNNNTNINNNHNNKNNSTNNNYYSSEDDKFKQPKPRNKSVS